jgi:UDP-glucose 4-epimerase
VIDLVRSEHRLSRPSAQGEGTDSLQVLVTGGAGFIGTHISARLLELGHEVVIADDFSNSSPAAVNALRDLSRRPVSLVQLDLRHRRRLDQVFSDYPIDAVIHLAAKKLVRESVRRPLEYYDVNLGCLVTLVTVMRDHDVRRLVFSSSCSIYGAGAGGPISERTQPSPTNPYARSKLMCEQQIADFCWAYPQLSAIALRYFNPIGAHPSGVIGEDPAGTPGNVVPYMMRAATGELPPLPVLGSDYDTRDGTGVRDYVHVMDVAEAHCLALAHFGDAPGLQAFNIGTGMGVSVLELIDAFRTVTGVAVPYEIGCRQPGDVASLVADSGKVEREWNWQARRSLDQMLADAWRFHRLHPHGYGPGPALHLAQPPVTQPPAAELLPRQTGEERHEGAARPPSPRWHARTGASRRSGIGDGVRLRVSTSWRTTGDDVLREPNRQ